MNYNFFIRSNPALGKYFQLETDATDTHKSSFGRLVREVSINSIQLLLFIYHIAWRIFRNTCILVCNLKRG